MRKDDFTDEELMAYADGELEADRASQLDAALVAETALADRLAVFVETRALSKKSFEATLREPVPEHLIQKARDLAAETSPEATNVIPFSQRSASAPFWKLPLAAALALAVGLGAGMLISTDGSQTAGGIVLARLTDAQLSDALNTIPSGEFEPLTSGAQIAPIATFYDGSQRLCREFELRNQDGPTVVSVACERNGMWDLQLAIATAAADDGGYVPASSLEALDAYLDAENAGPPLDLDAESSALQNLR